jgi:hypothetical protein
MVGFQQEKIINHPDLNTRLLHFGNFLPRRQTRGVSQCGVAICIKKYLKAKEEESWKLKYFTMQKYNVQKIPPKECRSSQPQQ